MQKIKAFIIILLMVFQATTAQENQINSELDSAYRVLINSDSYKDFEKAGRTFMTKTVFRGDPILMGYENKFLETLKTRIKETRFKDFEEAISEYDSLKAKYLIIQKDNTAFFSALKESEFWDLANIMYIKSTKDDPCGCEKSYGETLRTVGLRYETLLKTNESSAVTGWMAYEDSKKSVLRAMELCHIGCEE